MPLKKEKLPPGHTSPYLGLKRIEREKGFVRNTAGGVIACLSQQAYVYAL